MGVELTALLGRAEMGFGPQGLDCLRGARIVITGAGGSIGSDLCRHVVSASPASLVLIERHENSLHDLLTSLQDAGCTVPLVPTLTDVTDAPRIEALFDRCRPDVVFHAAAHKHVPLMQQHVCEAVRNNVTGTHVVARASRRCGAERFVLLSTDKAADPVSVMGMTKAAAEAVVRLLAAAGGGPLFVTVRLGNVLGSAGSVVPRFLARIRQRQPVAVRHPNASRHFLLASEAVGFITAAAAIAQPGYSAYLPEMGDAVNIADLARALVRASTGHADVDGIVFTELLPGERVSETLVGRGETRVPTELAHVSRLIQPPLDARTAARIAELERAAAGDDEGRTLRVLRELCAGLVTQPAT